MSFHLKQYLFFRNILLQNNQYGGVLEWISNFLGNGTDIKKYNILYTSRYDQPKLNYDNIDKGCVILLNFNIYINGVGEQVIQYGMALDVPDISKFLDILDNNDNIYGLDNNIFIYINDTMKQCINTIITSNDKTEIEKAKNDYINEKIPQNTENNNLYKIHHDSIEIEKKGNIKIIKLFTQEL